MSDDGLTSEPLDLDYGCFLADRACAETHTSPVSVPYGFGRGLRRSEARRVALPTSTEDPRPQTIVCGGQRFSLVSVVVVEIFEYLERRLDVPAPCFDAFTDRENGDDECSDGVGPPPAEQRVQDEADEHCA